MKIEKVMTLIGNFYYNAPEMGFWSRQCSICQLFAFEYFGIDRSVQRIKVVFCDGERIHSKNWKVVKFVCEVPNSTYGVGIFVSGKRQIVHVRLYNLLLDLGIWPQRGCFEPICMNLNIEPIVD